MNRTTKLFAAAALIALGAAACNNDELIRPPSITPIDPLFTRYVSMGNSITAGFQSAGLNDSTQRQSYAVLLAQAMHSPFFVPYMTNPGCPPPFSNVFTQARVTPTGYPTSTASSCYLRKQLGVPPPYVSNTAVPGAEVLDLYNNLDTASNSNTLTMFFLGGLTQTQMMERAHPTFVSVWAGNNDVLGAAATYGGDSTKITPALSFQARTTALLDSIDAAGPRGVVVIGVANVTAAPFFSRGSVYWAIKNGLVPGAAFPPAFTVSTNCAPNGVPTGRGDSTLVPFPYGAALLQAASPPNNLPRNLDCADTVAAVVVPKELLRLVGAVAAYNAFDSTQAAQRGWAWFNPNVALATLAADTAQVRAFPYFPQGNPGDTVAVRRPFGRAFSLDGIHPSASTHKLIANALIAVINGKYSTNVPTIP